MIGCPLMMSPVKFASHGMRESHALGRWGYPAPSRSVPRDPVLDQVLSAPVLFSPTLVFQPRPGPARVWPARCCGLVVGDAFHAA